MTEPLDSVDRSLLLRLGRVARAADPAPDLVHELGRAAFALRRLDAELAELVADSALDAGQLAGVRGAGEARLLSFECDDVGVEVEVRDDAGGRVLVGQVIASQAGAPASVRLETARGASASAPVDAVGGFRFDGVTAGPVRLHVERAGASVVTTSWVNV
jgi:hypothetical protein